jgi:hypothetical protein
MKKLAIILFGTSLLVAGGVLFVFSHRAREGKPVASLHRYELAKEPTLLTEELAAAYANRALIQDGFDTNRWHPVHDRRIDEWGIPAGAFAVRNRNNSNHVCIAFTCDQMPAPRFLSVFLLGKVVMCETSVPD